MKFEMAKDKPSIIKVIGVGGGGGNAVNHMYNLGIKGVDFLLCNTDSQALELGAVPHKIQLGGTLTEGLGAGSIPEVGKNAAIESIDEIKSMLAEGTKMVFITAGMGGGTGTGASPIIAAAAKEMGILTVAIVTTPFSFEGPRRKQQSEHGLAELKKNVDAILIISNDKLREMYGNLSITSAFSHADNVLTTAAKGISEIISVTGIINRDFRDVTTVMKDSGVAIMGSGSAEGDDRAIKAVEEALKSPLLRDNNIKGARYILLSISSGTEEILTDEVSAITEYIQDEAGQDADVIFGLNMDESLGNKVAITLIASGFKALDEIPAPKKISVLSDELPKINDTEISSAPIIKEIKKVAEVPLKPLKQASIFDEEAKDPEKVSMISNAVSQQIPFEPTIQNKIEEKAPVRRFIMDENGEVIDRTSPEDAKKLEEIQAQKAKERANYLKEVTMKLRTPGGINDLENEPAYLRRKVEINHSTPSIENNISKYSIGEDSFGRPEIRPNNSFLHDNVD